MSNCGNALRLTRRQQERGDLRAKVWCVLECMYTVECMYLSTFLRSVHPHHVVFEKLLKELHLGNAEVEIQTAGHIYLQRVATHHHLLERDEIVQGEMKRGRWVERAGKTFNNTSGLFVNSWPASLFLNFYICGLFTLYLPSVLLRLAHLFPIPLFPLSSPGSHPQPAVQTSAWRLTSNRISLTNTLGWTAHTWARPTVTTHNGIWPPLCKHNLFRPTV